MPIPSSQKRRDDDEEQISDENRRDENRLEPVRELLCRCLLRLGLGDELDDSVERPVARCTSGLNFKCPLAIDRPCKDLRPHFLLDRHGFAGDGRLVDRRSAAPHNAVYGNAFGRSDHHNLAF